MMLQEKKDRLLNIEEQYSEIGEEIHRLKFEIADEESPFAIGDLVTYQRGKGCHGDTVFQIVSYNGYPDWLGAKVRYKNGNLSIRGHSVRVDELEIYHIPELSQ